MSDVADDVIFLIFTYLDCKTLCLGIELTCSRWKHITSGHHDDADRLWKAIYAHHWKDFIRDVQYSYEYRARTLQMSTWKLAHRERLQTEWHGIHCLRSPFTVREVETQHEDVNSSSSSVSVSQLNKHYVLSFELNQGQYVFETQRNYDISIIFINALSLEFHYTDQSKAAKELTNVIVRVKYLPIEVLLSIVGSQAAATTLFGSSVNQYFEDRRRPRKTCVNIELQLNDYLLSKLNAALPTRDLQDIFYNVREYRSILRSLDTNYSMLRVPRLVDAAADQCLHSRARCDTLFVTAESEADVEQHFYQTVYSNKDQRHSHYRCVTCSEREQEPIIACAVCVDVHHAGHSLIWCNHKPYLCSTATTTNRPMRKRKRSNENSIAEKRTVSHVKDGAKLTDWMHGNSSLQTLTSDWTAPKIDVESVEREVNTMDIGLSAVYPVGCEFAKQFAQKLNGMELYQKQRSTNDDSTFRDMQRARSARIHITDAVFNDTENLFVDVDGLRQLFIGISGVYHKPMIEQGRFETLDFIGSVYFSAKDPFRSTVVINLTAYSKQPRIVTNEMEAEEEQFSEMTVVGDLIGSRVDSYVTIPKGKYFFADFRFSQSTILSFLLDAAMQRLRINQIEDQISALTLLVQLAASFRDAEFDSALILQCGVFEQLIQLLKLCKGHSLSQQRIKLQHLLIRLLWILIRTHYLLGQSDLPPSLISHLQKQTRLTPEQREFLIRRRNELTESSQSTFEQRSVLITNELIPIVVSLFEATEDSQVRSSCAGILKSISFNFKANEMDALAETQAVTVLVTVMRRFMVSFQSDIIRTTISVLWDMAIGMRREAFTAQENGVLMECVKLMLQRVENGLDMESVWQSIGLISFLSRDATYRKQIVDLGVHRQLIKLTTNQLLYYFLGAMCISELMLHEEDIRLEVIEAGGSQYLSDLYANYQSDDRELTTGSLAWMREEVRQVLSFSHSKDIEVVIFRLWTLVYICNLKNEYAVFVLEEDGEQIIANTKTSYASEPLVQTLSTQILTKLESLRVQQ